MIEVRYQRGLYLPELDLWLDSRDAKPHAFVSHAHADHFARHQNILCSEVTATLLRHRYRIAEQRLAPSAFHVPIERNGFRLRLLPAGHISGSAMLHITRIADNASLLYTGDFKTRRSRTAESVNFLTADTLIMETTFGLPGYEFPNQMEVDAEILRFIGDSFSDGETPVLLAYPLGKSQEIIALLHEQNIPTLLHPSTAAMTAACREAGVQGLPEPILFDGHAPPGHVLIAPPQSVKTDLLKGIKAKRTAMLSGWALLPGAKFRFRVDAMIPLSDHADHPGLMECIQRVRPRRILTVHGYEREFAAALRTRQIDAWSAAGGDQLELPIQRPAPRPQTPRSPWQKRVVCTFADFSDLCKLVAETGSRIAKTRFITTYLATLENENDIKIVVRWLTHASPIGKTRKATAYPDADTLRRALISLTGAREERYQEIHQTQKDLARTARQFLQELQLRPELLDISNADTFIRSFRETPASLDRIRTLAERLAALHPAESETLIKLLLGNLQLGIHTTLVETAIAAAYNTEVEDIQKSAKLLGDHGEAAANAWQTTRTSHKKPLFKATSQPD